MRDLNVASFGSYVLSHKIIRFLRSYMSRLTRLEREQTTFPVGPGPWLGLLQLKQRNAHCLRRVNPSPEKLLEDHISLSSSKPMKTATASENKRACKAFPCFLFPCKT